MVSISFDVCGVEVVQDVLYMMSYILNRESVCALPHHSLITSPSIPTSVPWSRSVWALEYAAVMTFVGWKMAFI